MKDSAEKGEEKTFKRLLDNQQSVIEEAQSKGLIDCKQEDQVKAVIEIIDMLAVDPSYFLCIAPHIVCQKVKTCPRAKHEYLQTFVSRFQGLVEEHIMHAGVYNT